MSHTANAIAHLAKGSCSTAELAAAIGVPSAKLGHLLKYAVTKGKIARTTVKEPYRVRTSVWWLPDQHVEKVHAQSGP